MAISSLQIRALVANELAGVSEPSVKAYIGSLLVEPQIVMRQWDYGEIGEVFPCWSVLNHSRSNTGIAYCEYGFGPKNPWGLVGLSGSDHKSMGMDCGWFPTFLEAFFDSAASMWSDLQS